jgi:hypothetical protein
MNYRFIFIILLFSILSGSTGWTIFTYNHGEIQNATIHQVGSDSLHIIANDLEIQLKIDEISKITFNRLGARLMITTISSVIGTGVGIYTGFKIFGSSDSEDIYQFILDLGKRAIIYGTVGSIPFGYFGYRLTKDIEYDFRKLSQQEKIKVLNDLRT